MTWQQTSWYLNSEGIRRGREVGGAVNYLPFLTLPSKYKWQDEDHVSSVYKTDCTGHACLWKGYCTAFKRVEYLCTLFLLKVQGEDAFLHPEPGYDVCEEQGEWRDGEWGRLFSIQILLRATYCKNLCETVIARAWRTPSESRQILKSLGFSDNWERIFFCHIWIASFLGTRIWVRIFSYLAISKAVSNHFHLEMEVPSGVTGPEPSCS